MRNSTDIEMERTIGPARRPDLHSKWNLLPRVSGSRPLVVVLVDERDNKAEWSASDL